MGSVSTIPITDPMGYIVPPTAGFVPDRMGVRRISIDIDRTTGAYRCSLTPCPATKEAWGPTDAPEVVTPDLVAELLALPDSSSKLAALAAVQRVAADLVTVAAAVLAGRESPAVRTSAPHHGRGGTTAPV